jgi:DNA-binding response OmpR family regulator
MGQPRVLIVEDDATMAETIASIVQLLGFHAIVTHNSRQALAAATREHPDVILLDINLPGINGIDVCRFLKREPALETTPVIVVSSEKDPETFVKAREAGAIDYLIKPVGVNDLELAIGKALNP